MVCEHNPSDFKTRVSYTNHRRWCEWKMEVTRKKFSLMKMGDKNPLWKERPGLYALHIWARRRIPKPEVCEICKVSPPLDLANKSMRYNRK